MQDIKIDTTTNDILIKDGDIVLENSILSDIKLTLFTHKNYWHNFVEKEEIEKIGKGYVESLNGAITNDTINNITARCKLALKFLYTKYNVKDLSVSVESVSVDRITVKISVILHNDIMLEIIV